MQNTWCCFLSSGRQTNTHYIQHGQSVVAAVTAKGPEELRAFVVMWRQHFLDTMRPAHLPTGWSVHHRFEQPAANDEERGELVEAAQAWWQEVWCNTHKHTQGMRSFFPHAVSLTFRLSLTHTHLSPCQFIWGNHSAYISFSVCLFVFFRHLHALTYVSLTMIWKFDASCNLFPFFFYSPETISYFVMHDKTNYNYDMWTIITEREWISAYIFRVPYGPRCARLPESTYLPSRRRGKYDEVKRAHRGPYHEENIRRYSQARGYYCTCYWSFTLLWSFTDLVWGHLHKLAFFSQWAPIPFLSLFSGACGNTWSMTCSCFSVRMLSWISDVDIHKTSGWWLVVVFICFFLLLRFESRVAKWQKGLVLLWGLQRLTC